MPISSKFVKHLQQPNLSGLRPALGLPIRPSVLWLPQMGTRIWANSGVPPSTAIGTGAPRLVDIYHGRTFSSTTTTAGQFWSLTPVPVSYPCYAGAVFLPRNNTLGSVFSFGGSSGSTSTAPFLELVWLGSNQLQGRAKMALSGTQVSVTDFNTVFEEPTAAIVIARSSTELVLVTSASPGYQVNTSTGSTPSTETWGFAACQGIKRGTGTATGANVFTMMGFAGLGDPGDDWAKQWVKNPWSLVQGVRRRTPIPTTVTVYRPGSDIAVSGWTPSTGTDLYACIDEVTASDADYITSPDLSTTATMGLTAALPAGTWSVNFRGRYSAGAGADIRIVLLDSGGSVVGTSAWKTQTGSFADYTAAVTTTGTADRFRIEVQ